MCFDLFELVPDFNSLRTSWVHLYIKDLTLTSAATTRYLDYGLYEFIENTDENYLKAHNLDENGIVFKANFFEFYRYEDVIKKIKDPTYDPVKFATYLELKAGDPDTANKKLIRMLDDLNNQNLDIDQVFDTYFNRDNYFSYLALHILLGNYDSEERNYYSYSPHDSLTWYFLPWDYDKSLKADVSIDIFGNQADFIGISQVAWGIVLHNRMFRKAQNVEALNEKIETLYRQILSDSHQPID